MVKLGRDRHSDQSARRRGERRTSERQLFYSQDERVCLVNESAPQIPFVQQCLSRVQSIRTDRAMEMSLGTTTICIDVKSHSFQRAFPESLEEEEPFDPAAPADICIQVKKISYLSF